MCFLSFFYLLIYFFIAWAEYVSQEAHLIHLLQERPRTWFSVMSLYMPVLLYLKSEFHFLKIHHIMNWYLLRRYTTRSALHEFSRIIISPIFILISFLSEIPSFKIYILYLSVFIHAFFKITARSWSQEMAINTIYRDI